MTISPAGGAPGATVTLQGYGFAFVTVRFGRAHPRAGVGRGFATLTVRVPALRPGKVTITVANADGTAARPFTVRR